MIVYAKRPDGISVVNPHLYTYPLVMPLPFTKFAYFTDTQDPVITGCPSNITVGPDPGLMTAVVNWTEPTITDNSYSVMVIQNEYPNTVFNGGTVTVSYVATDPSGKTKTCSFTVTVTGKRKFVYMM